MKIYEACQCLKKELLNNGYKYGFYLNGKVYRPDRSKRPDRVFFNRLLTEYRVQDPEDTRREKVGTCNDAVLLMRSILNDCGVSSKIWVLHELASDKYHTIMTFYAEGKTVYLELTPEFDRANYGQEAIYESEQSFLDDYRQKGCEVYEATDAFSVGEPPDFILSKMLKKGG